MLGPVALELVLPVPGQVAAGAAAETLLVLAKSSAATVAVRENISDAIALPEANEPRLT